MGPKDDVKYLSGKIVIPKKRERERERERERAATWCNHTMEDINFIYMIWILTYIKCSASFYIRRKNEGKKRRGHQFMQPHHVAHNF